MGDLAKDTQITGERGRYRGTVSPDWVVVLPNGGFLAALALRAAAAESVLPRPAALSCHFLTPPTLDPVELVVAPLRTTKRAESLRVSMQQGDRAILEALVWMTAEGSEGFEHALDVMPAVAPPEEVWPWTPPEDEPYPADAFAIWRNIEARMDGWPAGQRWEDRTVGPPVRNEWCRFRPRATFDDPIVDAARAIILIDTLMYPAAMVAQPEPLAYAAPSIDLSVWFHASALDDEWLLCEATSPIARNGLVGGNARVWTRDGRLIASGGQQMLCRPIA